MLFLEHLLGSRSSVRQFIYIVTFSSPTALQTFTNKETEPCEREGSDSRSHRDRADIRTLPWNLSWLCY